MIPTMTAILNLSTVAVMWFGALRVDSGAMNIGNLTAFLQYLRRSCSRCSPPCSCSSSSRAPRSPRAASARCCDTTVGHGPGPAGALPLRRHGPRRVPRRRVPLPRRRGARAARHQFTAEPARPRPSSAAPAPASRPSPTSSRASTTRRGGSLLVDGVDVREHAPRGPVAPDQPRAAEGVPVQRHRREQPALRRRGRRPTTSSGARSRSPRPRLRGEMEGGLDAPITQGGTNVSGGQRQRLAIARALVQAGADLHLRRQLLGARLRDRRAAPRGARAGARRRDRDHRRAARRHHPATPTGSWSWTRAGSSASAPTHELLATNETYREIVYSQLSEEEAAA